MKLSKAQETDIALCKFFYPCSPTDEETEEYLAFSERGIGKKHGKFSTNPLILGKSRRGLTMEMWEDGVLEGSVPYVTLLGGFAGMRNKYNPMRFLRGWCYHQPIPRFVVDFMKKEMFKGEDAEIIEKCYLSFLV